jgi:glucans biosynthesis protein C
MSDLDLKKSPDRIYYLDYLRVFIVFVVIFLHSLLPFVIDYDWTINDTVKVLPFTSASMIIDVFVMPIMFFIAGYFAFPSIRKGIKEFIVGKVLRILIPWIIGLAFLAPIISYLGLIQHKVIDVPYLVYWTQRYFNSPINQQHFWFLISLFLFFMIFALVYALMKKQLERIYEASKSHRPSARNIGLFILLILCASIGLYYLAGRYFPDGTWNTFLYVVAMQVTRWTGYVLYFIAGIITFIKRVDLKAMFRKHALLLSCAWIFISNVFIDFKYSVYFTSDLAYLKPEIQFYNAIYHVAFCFITFITLVALFANIDRPIKYLQRLAKNSYTIYIVHMVYTVILQYYIVNWRMDVYTKFLIILAGTSLLSFATAELISWFWATLRKIQRPERIIEPKS